MASARDFLDYVLEQLSELDDINYRPMMGEYVIYYKDKVIGGVYDDRLLLKPVPCAVKMTREPSFELPYEGAKEMLLADTDDRELLCRIIEAMFDELPEKKKRR